MDQRVRTGGQGCRGVAAFGGGEADEERRRCRELVAATRDEGEATPVTSHMETNTNRLHCPNSGGEHVSGQLLSYFLSASFPDLEGGASSACKQ